MPMFKVQSGDLDWMDEASDLHAAVEAAIREGGFTSLGRLMEVVVMPPEGPTYMLTTSVLARMGLKVEEEPPAANAVDPVDRGTSV
jgi:hypothetical protein